MAKKTPPAPEDVELPPVPPQEVDIEQLVNLTRALQMQTADRLSFIRIFQQAFTTIEGAMGVLQSDISQLNAGIEARNAQTQEKLPTDAPEAADE
jgi:hypothetical protein